MAVGVWGAQLVELVAGENWYVYAASYMVGSIMLGLVMAALIEIPVLKFRDRFYPSRAPSALPLTRLPYSNLSLG